MLARNQERGQGLRMSNRNRTAQEYQAALIALQTEQASLKGSRTRNARERFRAITAEFFALKGEWKKAADAGQCQPTA